MSTTHAAPLSIAGCAIGGGKIAVIRDRKRLPTNPLVYINIHNFELTIRQKNIKLLKKRSQKDFRQTNNIYKMKVIDLLPYIADGFTYFLLAIGISTFIFPVRMTLHPPAGILLGVAMTSSATNPQENLKYIFFQIHLFIFSIGVFINLGIKEDE